MTLIPENKIYACEEGTCCFYCIGKENCNNYRLGFKFPDFSIKKEEKFQEE